MRHLSESLRCLPKATQHICKDCHIKGPGIRAWVSLGGPFFSQLKGGAEVFLQLKCTKWNSEGEISLGADEKGDGGGGRGLGRISQRPQRPHPSYGHEGHSHRPTQCAEVLTPHRRGDKGYGKDDLGLGGGQVLRLGAER